MRIPTGAIPPSAFFQQHYSFPAQPPSPSGVPDYLEDITMSTKKEPDAVRTRKVEITMPEKFLEIAEQLAGIEEVSVDALIIEALVSQIAFDMEEPLGVALHWGGDRSEYAKKLKSLAWPERAQEVSDG